MNGANDRASREERDGVLLLGGGGFIGRALAARLAVEGRPVHVLTRRPLSLAGVDVQVGDLADGAILDGLLERCGTVVYLASTTTPGVSAARPVLELGNLTPALALLERLHGDKDRHLIFFSSGGTVYGNPQHNPVAEDSRPAPLSYHGAGKVAQEAFLEALRASGPAVTILRPANAYGPGQELRQGFGLIRTVLEHARRGTPLAIWGDGASLRDYVFVADVAEACVRFIDLPGDSGAYNVGSGIGHSINDVLQLASRITGRDVAIQCRPARGIDVRAVVLDCSRLQSRLGWRPAVSLEEGMTHTWEWLLHQP